MKNYPVLYRKPVPELLRTAFGDSAEGVEEAENFLDTIPEGQKVTNRIALFLDGETTEAYRQSKLALVALAEKKLELTP